jgi:nucleotide-binding universal stress UspA family protein
MVRAALDAALWAVDEAVSRDIPLRLVYAMSDTDTDGAARKLASAELAVRYASTAVERRYPDLDLPAVAVNGSAVNYLAKHAADIQLVVMGCGDRGDVDDLLGPTGSAALHDTDCSLLICNRHQRL